MAHTVVITQVYLDEHGHGVVLSQILLRRS